MASIGIIRAARVPKKASNLLWGTPITFGVLLDQKLRLFTPLSPTKYEKLSWFLKCSLVLAWNGLTLSLWLIELNKTKTHLSAFQWLFQLGAGALWVFCVGPLFLVELFNRRDCTDGFNSCVQMEEEIRLRHHRQSEYNSCYGGNDILSFCIKIMNKTCTKIWQFW
jgi:hypothetical protein